MKSSFSPVMHLTGDVKYAAIYARVSTEDQGKGFSIPTQIEASQKLAARDGYSIPDGYVLTDEGISGTINPVVSMGTTRYAEQHVAPSSAAPGGNASSSP